MQIAEQLFRLLFYLLSIPRHRQIQYRLYLQLVFDTRTLAHRGGHLEISQAYCHHHEQDHDYNGKE